MPLAFIGSLAADQSAALIFLCVVLIIEAWIDLTQLRVPNRITYPMILAGWAYAFGRAFVVAPSDGPPIEMYLWPFGPEFTLSQTPLAEGLLGLWYSFKLTVLGFLLLIFMYAIGGMGAGDVKMQMGFGAWVAPIFGYSHGLMIVFWGWIFAVLIGGVISAIMIWWRGDFRQNRQNVKDIVGDLVSGKSVGQIADRAAERKPRMHLLPYGVPLCLGFIGYIVLDHLQMWPKLW